MFMQYTRVRACGAARPARIESRDYAAAHRAFNIGKKESFEV